MHSLTIPLALLLLLLSGASAEKPITLPPRGITLEQALRMVDRLPETRAWAAYITKKNKGTKAGGCIGRYKEPELIAGRWYWRIDFMEWFTAPEPSTTHRWDTFLVRISDGRIFYYDIVEDKILSLSQWRKERHPLQGID